MLKVVKIIIAAILFPVLIPGILLLLGQRLDSILFSLTLYPIFNIVGVFIIVIGFLLSLASIWQLHRLGSGMPWGDVSPDDQSSNLVTDGVYKHSRNPMLLGFGLYLMGVGLFFGSFSTAFLFSFLVIVLVSFWIKLIEEPKLVKRFGKEYVEYREKTPFLIPEINSKRN